MHKIRVVHRFGHSAERVFDAWLDAGTAGAWLFATAWRPMVSVQIDAREGGRFRFVGEEYGRRVEYAGEYLRIGRPLRLELSLSSADGLGEGTLVSVGIEPSKRGCELSLEHDRLPTSRADEMANRWSGILYGLNTMLASYSANSQPKTRRESTSSGVANPRQVSNLAVVRALPDADFAGFPSEDRL
jgi:uncharacterized protein YndB with AHSA1/START domain